MKFTEIKYANNRVHLKWKEEKNSDIMTVELESNDQPLQTLEESLQALAPYVCTILELPEEYTTGLTVTKVGFSEGGFQIIAKKEIEGSNSPFNINTPHLKDDAEAVDGDLLRAIDKVISEAKRFRKGQRNQIELPLGATTGEGAQEDPE